MAWFMVILGLLASFGLLCAIWALFGWCFGSDRDGILLCLCKDGREHSLIVRYSQLRKFGLLKCPLVLIGSSMSAQEQAIVQRTHPGIEFCTPEQLPARLEK